jgi:hypothetical protein
MKIRTGLCLWLLLGLTTQAQAQEQKPISVSLEARADYQRDYVDGKSIKEHTGFKGNIINLLVKGDLGERFSYMYRQRLSGINKDHSFFDATDWLYLSYHLNPQFSLAAGKWAVMTGGWEFDPAPIDVFQVYEFAYHFPCYEWGVWGTYETRSKHDHLILQIIESPFQRGYNRQADEKGEMYAYNLVWSGHHGPFHPLCSANMMEYEPGKFINYLCIGSRIDIGQKLKLQMDYMNRAAAHQSFFFADCSLSGMVEYTPSDKVRLWGKASYDVNHTHNEADVALKQGTEITRLGAGIEYMPLGDRHIRLHAHYSYSFGSNTTPDPFLHDRQSIANVGVTWRMKVL